MGLLKNETDLRRWDSERFCRHLTQNSLGHVAPRFAENHIDGKAFMDEDIINEQSLKEEMKIENTIDVKRLLELQKLALTGTNLPSAAAKELANTLPTTLDELEKGTTLIK